MTSPPFGTWVRGNRWDTAPRAPLRTVSVVVPHYEQPRQLARTLGALARQTHPPVEVIVADDGSAVAPDVPDGVRLVRQDDRGFRAAAARNLGEAAAVGDILVFLDADTTPEPAFLAAIARLPSALPEAVVVGRRRHADLAAAPIDVPIEVAGPDHELPSPMWLADGYRASRDLLKADDRSYRYVISAVLACTRWFFDEVGGFDETFVGYGGEDWEWAHRAWLAGAVLAHAPDAVAWHDGPDWAGRHAGDPAAWEARTAETLRLAAAIPVAGSRPRGLRSARPDIVVDARMPAFKAARSSVGADRPPASDAVRSNAVGARMPASDAARSNAVGARMFASDAARSNAVGARMFASDPARFVTVDALLEALPEARIVVPDASAFADQRVVQMPVPARVTVTVEHPVAFLGDAGARFAAAVRALGVGERGGLVARTADGVVFARAESSRAAACRMRWGTASAFDTNDLVVDGAVLVGPTPNVEAWLGGWAGPAQLG